MALMYMAVTMTAMLLVQTTLSVVLLVGGMLFVRSLVAARAMDLGFDARDRVLVSVNVALRAREAESVAASLQAR